MRHEVRQKRGGGDVEGHTQEEIRRPLVHLHREASVFDVELVEHVAGRQRGGSGRVPSVNNVSSRVRILLQTAQKIGDLIHPLIRSIAVLVLGAEMPPQKAVNASGVFLFDGIVRLGVLVPCARPSP